MLKKQDRFIVVLLFAFQPCSKEERIGPVFYVIMAGSSPA
jgi:hypothetical protein